MVWPLGWNQIIIYCLHVTKSLCHLSPPVADYMSAVYQDVIEGYLIASIKVCMSTSNEIQWNQDNSLKLHLKCNPTKHCAQLVGWFIFGSLLILKGAFLNYLDDSGLAQPDGSSSARWGRSVEVRQHSFWNADAYDHWPFSLFQFIFNPGLPQCAFWKTINSYFVDIATFSIFSPDHILHLAARSRQSHRVWVKCLEHEERKSMTVNIWKKSKRVAPKVMKKLHSTHIIITMRNLENNWEDTKSCIFVLSFTHLVLTLFCAGDQLRFCRGGPDSGPNSGLLQQPNFLSHKQPWAGGGAWKVAWLHFTQVDHLLKRSLEMWKFWGMWTALPEKFEQMALDGELWPFKFESALVQHLCKHVLLQGLHYPNIRVECLRFCKMWIWSTGSVCGAAGIWQAGVEIFSQISPRAALCTLRCCHRVPIRRFNATISTLI